MREVATGTISVWQTILDLTAWHHTLSLSQTAIKYQHLIEHKIVHIQWKWYLKSTISRNYIEPSTVQRLTNITKGNISKSVKVMTTVLITFLYTITMINLIDII